MKHPTRPARKDARPARALVVLFALVLVTSNALAAMGVCIVKAPAVSAVPAALDIRQSPCVQHPADGVLETVHGDPAAPVHCPQDDPGVQVRAGDAPVLGVALVAALPRLPIACETGAWRGFRAAADSPPTPLYTRLSRLLL